MAIIFCMHALKHIRTVLCNRTLLFNMNSKFTATCCYVSPLGNVPNRNNAP